VAARAPSIPVIALSITVSNVDSAGNAYNIQNDGQGPYVDGLQQVEARLDNYGTLAFNTQTKTSRPAVRWVTYNFSNPVDPSNAYRPDPDRVHNNHFSTGASAFSPFIPIQNLGVNGNPASECVYMGNSIANATTSWRVSFHKGNEDVAASPTSYAVVTRVSVSPAVWTIASAGNCSPNQNIASLRSGDGTVLYGYYYIPFLFTLRAK
jgi:hypothetical protein